MVQTAGLHGHQQQALQAQLHNRSQVNGSHLHSMQHHNGSHIGLFGNEEDHIDPKYAGILLYILLFLMLGAQTALFAWKKHHQRSYELVTLTGLWLMPAIICVHLHFWRFLLVWIVYSTVTGYFMYLCLGKKADHTTPRKVYTWFLGSYKVSLAMGMCGYVLLILEMFGAGPLLNLVFPQAFSLTLLFYGLYFGILGRDCAEVASDRLALVLSGGRRLGTSVNSCGMCGGELKDFSHMGEDLQEGSERCIQLSCKHCFHELCVRGWTVVGKKDVCPVCLEKVDLRSLYADRPWETRNLSWIQMLDALRYTIVWNPVIFLVFSAIAHLFPHVHGNISAHLSGQSALPSPALGLHSIGHPT